MYSKLIETNGDYVTVEIKKSDYDFLFLKKIKPLNLDSKISLIIESYANNNFNNWVKDVNILSSKFSKQFKEYTDKLGYKISMFTLFLFLEKYSLNKGFIFNKSRNIRIGKKISKHVTFTKINN